MEGRKIYIEGGSSKKFAYSDKNLVKLESTIQQIMKNSLKKKETMNPDLKKHSYAQVKTYKRKRRRKIMSEALKAA